MSPEAVVVAKQAAGQRWAAERDLTDALESLAVAAVVAAAEAQRPADRWRTSSSASSGSSPATPACATRWPTRRADAGRKEALVSSLLEGKAAPTDACGWSARPCSPRAAASSDRAWTSYLALARRPPRPARRASCAAAAALDEEQQRAARRGAVRAPTAATVQLNVVVDPDVIGGIRVQIGDEVIDGTIPRRLEEARGTARLTQPPPATQHRTDRHRNPADHEAEQPRRRDDMAELTIRPEEIRDALEQLRPVLRARRGLPRRGRPRHRRRRRHRPRRGPALGDGERAARVRGRHPGPGAEPRRPRDRCRRPR